MPTKNEPMTEADVIAAIRANHLKANIDMHEREPERWGAPQWDDATVDPGGTIYGEGPYLKVPIVGGEWDGTRQRVYAPERLRRRLARLWTGNNADAFTCGQCGATCRYERGFDSDMPEDWFRLEDRASVFVVCSMRCLSALVKTLELPLASDAVDPHLSARGTDAGPRATKRAVHP